MNPSVDVPLKTVKNGERMFPGIYKTLDRLVDAKADGTDDDPPGGRGRGRDGLSGEVRCRVHKRVHKMSL